MVFTKQNGILIKVLRQSKGYIARKLLEEFPDKDLSCSALDRLWRKIDTLWSTDRKSGSSRERTVCTRDMQVSVQMATTLSANCKSAKRISNSDKICHSYCDFYFGVTFF